MSSSTTSKYNFQGKVALVTGSSSGIGAQIATAFARNGAQVTITGRNGENLNAVAQKIEQQFGIIPLQIVGSLSDDDSLPKRLIDETIAKFGRLDFLVNDAATNSSNGRFSSPQIVEAFDSVFKVNVRVPVELIQRAVPHLEATKGNVINVSSALSLQASKDVIYPASKAALDMVTKTVALELGPKGIRVNAINPGLVATNFVQTMGFSKEQNDQFYIAQNALSLMGRIGHPEDIANLAVFLASDDAQNITGSLNLCDSGWMLKH